MIRRLFYFSLGFVTAVWAMRKIRSLHPDHVARRAVNAAAGAGTALREFVADVRHLAAAREMELRAEYGLDSVDVTAGGRAADRRALPDHRRPAALGPARSLEARRGTIHPTETHDEKDGR
ncbi:MAG: hypothetical protein DIU60_010440 [Actinomycetes bacterium]